MTAGASRPDLEGILTTEVEKREKGSHIICKPAADNMPLDNKAGCREKAKEHCTSRLSDPRGDSGYLNGTVEKSVLLTGGEEKRRTGVAELCLSIWGDYIITWIQGEDEHKPVKLPRGEFTATWGTILQRQPRGGSQISVKVAAAGSTGPSTEREGDAGTEVPNYHRCKAAFPRSRRPEGITEPTGIPAGVLLEEQPGL